MDEITYLAEGLKAMNNAAVDMVLNGEYDKAEKTFRTVEETSRLFCYEEGVGMARTSLANLSMIKGDLIKAIDHAEAAVEFFPPGGGMEEAYDLLKRISIAALETGIEKERSGDLEGALELFERILPVLNEKRAELVAAEIENIKQYLGNGGG
jgi:tetratricopeptide (TPR) repeat protein